jgi:hypothetical protein
MFSGVKTLNLPGSKAGTTLNSSVAPTRNHPSISGTIRSGVLEKTKWPRSPAKLAKCRLLRVDDALRA